MSRSIAAVWRRVVVWVAISTSAMVAASATAWAEPAFEQGATIAIEPPPGFTLDRAASRYDRTIFVGPDGGRLVLIESLNPTAAFREGVVDGPLGSFHRQGFVERLRRPVSVAGRDALLVEGRIGAVPHLLWFAVFGGEARSYTVTLILLGEPDDAALRAVAEATLASVVTRAAPDLALARQRLAFRFKEPPGLELVAVSDHTARLATQYTALMSIAIEPAGWADANADPVALSRAILRIEAPGVAETVTVEPPVPARVVGRDTMEWRASAARRGEPPGTRLIAWRTPLANGATLFLYGVASDGRFEESLPLFLAARNTLTLR